MPNNPVGGNVGIAPQRPAAGEGKPANNMPPESPMRQPIDNLAGRRALA